MRRVPLDGMWYGDLTADGASVASARDGSHVLLNGERLNVPAQYGGVLQIRIAPNGRTFGGQPQTGTKCILFNGAWRELPQQPIGPNSLIFDNDGNPIVAIAGEHTPTGSQGYWYIDDAGVPVPSKDVYGPTPSVPRLYLHTTRTHPVYGPISIGQGDLGGVAAWIGGRLVKVADGDTEYVRFPPMLGDQLGICWSEQKILRTTFIWPTVAELAAMPDYPSAGEPEPDPIPEPEPIPVPDSLLQTVERIWEKYGGQDRGKMLNEVAWIHRAQGWGLSRKANGHNVPSPVGPIASDILHHKPTDTLWDAFNDAGPIWIQAGHHNDPGRPWVAPVAPDGVPVPDPDDPEPPSGEIDFNRDIKILISKGLIPLAKQLERLADIVQEQELRIAVLEQDNGGGNGDVFPVEVGIRSIRTRKFLTNDADKGEGDRIHADDRDGVGEWEAWELVRR